MFYFRFPHLNHAGGLIHGVFTRRGGVSPIPFDTLNVSEGVGDRPARVAANLQRIRGVLGAARLIGLRQCHGRRVVTVNACQPGQRSLPGDALVTNTPGLGLLIKQADCQGVILYDPGRRVLANVHCGWRGNVANILGHTVDRMREAFGCRPGDLLAGIGPSLGPCCAEFVTYREIFPQDFTTFMTREPFFDLWSLSRWQLVTAGLQPGNIQVARLCTRCRRDLFFSYRGEGETGRFATVAMLQDGRPGIGGRIPAPGKPRGPFPEG